MFKFKQRFRAWRERRAIQRRTQSVEDIVASARAVTEENADEIAILIGPPWTRGIVLRWSKAICEAAKNDPKSVAALHEKFRRGQFVQ